MHSSLYAQSLASNFWEPIKCLYLNNRHCWARATLISIKSYKTIYYPFNISDSKCEWNCNTADDQYTWVCVTNKVKNMNILN